MGTKTNPGRYDCIAAAEDDEPLFVLLGRDPFAASLVNLWRFARAAYSAKPTSADKLAEAREVADAMKNWVYTLRRESADVLDYIPINLLHEAIERRQRAVTNPSAAWPFPSSSPKADE